MKSICYCENHQKKIKKTNTQKLFEFDLDKKSSAILELSISPVITGKKAPLKLNNNSNTCSNYNMVLQNYGLNVNNDDVDLVKRGNNTASGHLVAMSPFPGDFAPATHQYYTDLDAVNYISQGKKCHKNKCFFFWLRFTKYWWIIIWKFFRIPNKERNLIEQLVNC